METISNAYKQYIDTQTGISTKDMAASLEACLYIFNTCQQHQYKKIIDLGSGITSFVLRYYQSLYDDVIVYSVDDNKEWLQKSIEYVASYNLNTENFIFGIDDINEYDFDFVVYDYGYMPVRSENLRRVISFCKDTGSIYCDDCHKISYYEYVKQIASNDYHITEIGETRDSFGRFGVVLNKKIK